MRVANATGMFPSDVHHTSIHFCSALEPLPISQLLLPQLGNSVCYHVSMSSQRDQQVHTCAETNLNQNHCFSIVILR